MDTQFDWLGSLPSGSSSRSSNSAAPPAVSFNLAAENGRVPHAHSYANVSSGSIPHSADPAAESVPLSLKAQELTLEESKTYMRWYSDILARTNSRTIAISDVYQFLGNFKIAAQIKEKINRIFSKILSSINIGEFFALLRVVSHALQGQEPARILIKKQTGVPVPPSILSKKRQNEEHEDEQDNAEDPADNAAPATPLDIDSFTQFMLTGERPNERKGGKQTKKLKSVKFSDQIVTDIQDTYQPAESPYQAAGLDYSLPMDQLLSKMKSSQPTNSLAVPPYDRRMVSPDPEEKQILRDMEPQMNHFKNLHSVDTISVDGVPANIHLAANSDFRSPRNVSPQPLQPNMTGPAQMASMAGSDGGWPSPLRPNVTGPADMARFFSPEAETPKVSLQAFTSQMTGNTMDNTAQNARIGNESGVSPPPVPSRRARSNSQPSPLNSTWRSYDPDHLHPADTKAGPPVPPRSPPVQRFVPPPPPPRARRISNPASPAFGSSSNSPAPPLPAKIPNEVYQNNEGSSSTANILDDLKALQEEVDKIRDLTGGF